LETFPKVNSDYGAPNIMVGKLLIPHCLSRSDPRTLYRFKRSKGLLCVDFSDGGFPS
jgi:hypothetical protein